MAGNPEGEPQKDESSREAYEDAERKEKQAGAEADEVERLLLKEEGGVDEGGNMSEVIRQREIEERAARREKEKIRDQAHDEAKKEDLERKKGKDNN